MSHSTTHPGHVDPLSIPWVPFPESSGPEGVVKLTLLHCGELTERYRQFSEGTAEGEKEVAAIFTWVIEKTFPGGRAERWLFDLGIVSDLNRLGEHRGGIIASRVKCDVPAAAQLPELLTHLSPPPATLHNLTGIILSHVHPDHYGALDDFPAELPVLVGPGTKEWVDSTPPQDKHIPPQFWAHPKVIAEIGEEGARGRGDGWYMVGAYQHAWDFYGDGSLWLAQAPGHCPGHLVAICRVSTSPDTYIVLGGDTCHSRQIYSPYPSPAGRCACAFFPNPFGPEPEKVTMHTDLEEAYESIARLTRMEMADYIMCVLAHETEVARELGVGIGEMKQGWEKWKENGWKKGKEGNSWLRAKSI